MNAEKKAVGQCGMKNESEKMKAGD